MEQSKEYRELLDMRRMIESEEFQKYLVKTLKEYRYKQKNNFFSDSLKDQWRKGGRVEGVNEFFNILKQIDNDFKNLAFDIENSSKA